MQKHLPPLSELRTFEAAARHLSFKAAAVELGVTPTAISHQIRLLEKYCGQPLFRRRPRPMALTAAGQRLFPVVRDGLDSFAAALAAIRRPGRRRPLRVTTTNAFAARWLLPRLPGWQQAHPDITLDVIGTDAVVDLEAGDADIAIRYARQPPANLVSHELCRDTFRATCNPALLDADRPIRSPADLLQYPLIDQSWPAADLAAPTWQRFEAAAARQFAYVPDLAGSMTLSFREELHALEAVIAGQGIAIVSCVLAAPELRTGKLTTIFDIELPGYGFHVSYRPGHPRHQAIARFQAWISALV